MAKIQGVRSIFGSLGTLLLLLTQWSCGQANAQTQPPDITLRVKVVESSDPTGVAGVLCPPKYRVIGGGCKCEKASSAIFSSYPVSKAESYLCACFAAPTSGSATVYATCLDAEAEGAQIVIQSLADRSAVLESARRQLLDTIASQR